MVLSHDELARQLLMQMAEPIIRHRKFVRRVAEHLDRNRIPHERVNNTAIRFHVHGAEYLCSRLSKVILFACWYGDTPERRRVEVLRLLNDRNRNESCGAWSINGAGRVMHRFTVYKEHGGPSDAVIAHCLRKIHEEAAIMHPRLADVGPQPRDGTAFRD